MSSDKPNILKTLRRPPVSVTAIAFSLTILGGSLVLLLGLVPATLSLEGTQIDVGVLLLMVPLCALLLAILVEVLNAALRGLPKVRDPIDAPALSGWRPGQGEG